MTYEEMQSRFLCPNQDAYSWFYCGFSSKTDVVSVCNLVEETYQPASLFVHKHKEVYYIGVDSETTITEDFAATVIAIDPPVAEEPVEEGAE